MTKRKVNTTIVVQGTFRLNLDAIDKMIGQALAVTKFSTTPGHVRVIPDLSKPLLAWAEARKFVKRSDDKLWLTIYDRSFYHGSANSRNNAAIQGGDSWAGRAGVVIQLGEVLGHYEKEGTARKSYLEDFLAWQIAQPKAPQFVQVLAVQDGFTSELMSPTSEWAVLNQSRWVLAEFSEGSGSESAMQKRVEATVSTLVP